MATGPALWESVAVGNEIPQLMKKPTYMQLFMFSAITWNRHLIHYNPESARSDGLPNVVTHRALIENFLAQMLSEWLGEAGRITKMEMRVQNSAVPGDTLICRGRVVRKHIEGTDKLIECEMWVENQRGDTVAPGKAEVMLFG